ncbi:MULTISPECIES: glycosyltransferase family 61 protein [Pseudomonas]|uniref:Glycosyltransferase family 61 protein n=1 Tax=Pseudomonas kielensis TaxID=2762577 RepID=A0A7X1GBS7_9PSED|nr:MULTISPECIES: glycosyltransferase family 61 protein [Pseudomonas]MBC2689519.1 glycosyltransferase family 61 protein [Pseudomonas kielensis]NBB33739.1 DUF563 domain-containing protein [Pseudomonas sp. BC115LW]
MNKLEVKKSTEFALEHHCISTLLESNENGFFKYFSRSTISFDVAIISKGRKHYKNEKIELPDLHICKVKNAVVTGKCGVLQGSTLIKDSLPPWMTQDNIFKNRELLKRAYHLEAPNDKDELFTHPEAEFDEISEPVVVLASCTDNAFSHYLFESFAKLHIMLNVDLNKFKWVVSSSIRSYQLNLLLDAGIKAENIIKKPHNTYLKVPFAIVIESPSHNNLWATPASLLFMRSFFKGLINKNPMMKATAKRIYLDRADERAAMRKIVNEVEIVDIAKKNDFSSYTPGALSFSGKIDAISNAEYIIGQYGGGLQLCFSARQGCRIVVLQSPHFFRAFISFMSVFFGFEVINIMGQSTATSEPKHNNSELLIDQADFEESLTQIL